MAWSSRQRRAAANLTQQFAGEYFVTLALLRIDVPSGAVAMVNAGHPLPILVRDGVVSTAQIPASPPLGMFADTLYVPERLQLRPGDRLILVSDGIIEARPVGGEALGENGLHELAARHGRPVGGRDGAATDAGGGRAPGRRPARRRDRRMPRLARRRVVVLGSSTYPGSWGTHSLERHRS